VLCARSCSELFASEKRTCDGKHVVLASITGVAWFNANAQLKARHTPAMSNLGRLAQLDKDGVLPSVGPTKPAIATGCSGRSTVKTQDHSGSSLSSLFIFLTINLSIQKVKECAIDKGSPLPAPLHLS
jgi:hypothetical protein